MMVFFRKVVWRLAMTGSKLFIGRDKRAIRHVHLKDFQLLVAANEDVGRQIMLFKDFEPEDSQFFREAIRPTDICFDVGGNVGFFAMLMAHRAAQGQVHVFEPIPLNAALIKTNAELNGFTNLHVHNVAVGDKECTVQFSISIDSAYSSMKATGRRDEERSLEVPMRSLDKYVDDAGIARVDIMKVDVEGAEGMVIEGASKLLSDAERRPRLVLLELFEPNLKPFETSVERIVNRMIEFGYTPQVHDGTGLIPFDLSMSNKFYNVIFTA